MFGFNPRAIFMIVGVLATARVVVAQGLTPEGSRAQLENAARTADSEHNAAQAFQLRSRLTNGDFQEGDRIVVSLLGQAVNRSDTLVVRAGKTLHLVPDQLGTVSLNGVLRSELSGCISAQVGKFLKDEVVEATPLVRLSVQGAVGRPGFYDAPADLLLSDVITRAGGTTQNADIRNVVIRRGDEIVWGAKDVQTALADGLSIDRLNMRAGDEITVGIQHSFPWQVILGTSMTVLGLMLTLFHK